MISTRLKLAALILMLLGVAAGAPGQTSKKQATKQNTATGPLNQARADLVAASRNYKASLEKLLPLEEAELNQLTQQLEQRKLLVKEGVISNRELEEGERSVATARAKVAHTRRQMTETDQLIAEASAEQQLKRLPSRLGSYYAGAALIRYNGAVPWLLTDIAKVQSFFASRFNRTLPVSAYGQTAVHNHLGFDHRNAVDLGVHPDSPEGQAIMAYLRSAGIPFLAFRQAVAGAATGAHIHVGYPSHRLR